MSKTTLRPTRENDAVAIVELEELTVTTTVNTPEYAGGGVDSRKRIECATENDARRLYFGEVARLAGGAGRWSVRQHWEPGANLSIMLDDAGNQICWPGEARVAP